MSIDLKGTTNGQWLAAICDELQSVTTLRVYAYTLETSPHIANVRAFAANGVAILDFYLMMRKNKWTLYSRKGLSDQMAQLVKECCKGVYA